MIDEKTEIKLNKDMDALLREKLDFMDAIHRITEMYEDKEEMVYAAATYGGMWAYD